MLIGATAGFEDLMSDNDESPNDGVNAETTGQIATVNVYNNVFNLFMPLMSWVFGTLEEATEVAKTGMSKKEGLVLLILYKRNGIAETARDLELDFRSWNDAHHSDRPLSDLIFAVSKLLNDGRISAFGLPAASGGALDLDKDSLMALRNIELTKDGWFRVGAMRAVIELRLKDAEAKFEGSHQQFSEVFREFRFPSADRDA